MIFFLSLYNFIKPASQVRTGCDYSIFKKGIRPMWEDKMNEKGGRWIIKFEYKSRDTEINKYWLDVVSICLGINLQRLNVNIYSHNI